MENTISYKKTEARISHKSAVQLISPGYWDKIMERLEVNDPLSGQPAMAQIGEEDISQLLTVLDEITTQLYNWVIYRVCNITSSSVTHR